MLHRSPRLQTRIMPTDRPSELPLTKFRMICGRKQFAKNTTERIPSANDTKSCMCGGISAPSSQFRETKLCLGINRTLLVHTQSSNALAQPAHSGSHVTPIRMALRARSAKCPLWPPFSSQRVACRACAGNGLNIATDCLRIDVGRVKWLAGQRRLMQTTMQVIRAQSERCRPFGRVGSGALNTKSPFETEL